MTTDTLPLPHDGVICPSRETGSLVRRTRTSLRPAAATDNMLKEFIKPLVRSRLVSRLQRYMTARNELRFEKMSPAEVFSEIYRRKMWGSAAKSDYCSGQGSHYQSIVNPYIESVRRFLSEFSTPPNAVDLGCGDFNVGSQLTDCCGQFVATDVVPDLIGRNARVFAHLNVSFRRLDIISDDLPVGDVAFLRQVAQHLTNAQIAQIIPKLYQYRWVVVSEHLPSLEGFVPNLDKPLGSGVRVPRSGVVLSAPPFNLRALEVKPLCSVPLNEMSGIVRTVAYRMAV